MTRTTKNRGTENVLADLGFSDAEELAAKAILARRGIGQVEAAARLGMAQPKVSAIRNYKLGGISLERLMQAPAAPVSAARTRGRTRRSGSPAR